MSQPDRWAKLADKEVRAYFGPEGTDDADVQSLVARLLRRQQAQFERLVKQRIRVLQPIVCKPRHSSFLRGKLVAYSDLLAALRKGRR